VIIPLGFEFNSQRLDVVGDFEIFILLMSTTILSFVIYNLLNSFMFRNLIRRFGLLKMTRKDFYECGFRPVTQKPIRLPIPFLLICIFFLLYDIELIFLFPLVSTVSFLGLTDLLLLLFFFFILFVSLIIDFNKHALT
jgi:NADH:ubiquinone oxidoreductase subunit 3 (subunit A)